MYLMSEQQRCYEQGDSSAPDEDTPAAIADLQAMELRIRRALGHLTEAIEDVAEHTVPSGQTLRLVRERLAKVRTYPLMGIGEGRWLR
jgi:hypothetical protein